MVQQGLTGRRMTYPAHSHPIPAHAAGRPGATDRSDRSGRHRGRCAAPTRRCRATCRARQQPAAREELRHVVDLSTMSNCSLMASARPQTPWPKSRSQRELVLDLASAASTCKQQCGQRCSPRTQMSAGSQSTAMSKSRNGENRLKQVS